LEPKHPRKPVCNKAQGKLRELILKILIQYSSLEMYKPKSTSKNKIAI
jgi:hypothetical protein